MSTLDIDLIPNVDNAEIVEPPDVDPIGIPVRVDNFEKPIIEWERGSPLDEITARDLRTAIFHLLEENIRWDELNMVKSHFAAPTSGSKPFKMVSISFEDQYSTSKYKNSVKN